MLPWTPITPGGTGNAILHTVYCLLSCLLDTVHTIQHPWTGGLVCLYGLTRLSHTVFIVWMFTMFTRSEFSQFPGTGTNPRDTKNTWISFCCTWKWEKYYFTVLSSCYDSTPVYIWYFHGHNGIFCCCLYIDIPGQLLDPCFIEFQHKVPPSTWAGQGIYWTRAGYN